MKTINYPIGYPESDGLPMADNTEQYEWITLIKSNLDIVFANREDVFVAGDLLWYPVEGNPKIRVAPDVLVSFGRPKGYRGSYLQWLEEDIAPQVVFEILSPSNHPLEMTQKLAFYEKYGVQEYYVYDPLKLDFAVWIREGEELRPLENSALETWRSPLMDVTFDWNPARIETLRLYYPDGRPFRSAVELDGEISGLQVRAEAERQRAERLAAKLRELGLNPDAL
jgi:Uma2 family endonuclease